MNRQALTVRSGIEAPETIENPLIAIIDENLNDAEKYILRSIGGIDAIMIMIGVNLTEEVVMTRGELLQRVTEQLTPVFTYLKADQAHRRGLEVKRTLEQSIDLWITTIDSFNAFCEETRYESTGDGLENVKYRFPRLPQIRVEIELQNDNIKEFIKVVSKANELWNAK